MTDVLLWTSSLRRASVGRATRTYLQQLCRNTCCRLKDLPEVMDRRDEWRVRVREIDKICLVCFYCIFDQYDFAFTF